MTLEYTIPIIKNITTENNKTIPKWNIYNLDFCVNCSYVNQYEQKQISKDFVFCKCKRCNNYSWYNQLSVMIKKEIEDRELRSYLRSWHKEQRLNQIKSKLAKPYYFIYRQLNKVSYELRGKYF